VSEQPTTTKRPRGIWGLTAPQFYADLREQPILLKMSTGEKFRGALIGVDQYDLFIRQDSGLVLKLSKGTIVYCHRA